MENKNMCVPCELVYSYNIELDQEHVHFTMYCSFNQSPTCVLSHSHHVNGKLYHTYV